MHSLNILHRNKQLRLKEWKLSGVQPWSKELFVKTNSKNGRKALEAEKSNCGNSSKMLLTHNSSEL